jgi:hypothetical protein
LSGLVVGIEALRAVESGDAIGDDVHRHGVRRNGVGIGAEAAGLETRLVATQQWSKVFDPAELMQSKPSSLLFHARQ